VFGPGGDYYHGTTPQAADKIAEHGFSLEHEANGRSTGHGVYLHDKAYRTAQYGPTTVAAELDDHLRIHQNPYNDPTAIHLADSIAAPGRSAVDHLPDALHLLGYHGHRDPDDHSTVVYDPKNVHYLTHYDPKEFGYS